MKITTLIPAVLLSSSFAIADHHGNHEGDQHNHADEHADQEQAEHQAASLEELAANDWKLLSASDAEGELELDGLANPPTLSIAEVDGNSAAYGGFSAVNRFFGGVSTEDQTINFGPGGMTRRAGPQAAMQVETRYVAALMAATHASIDDNNRLTITGEDISLTFTVLEEE